MNTIHGMERGRRDADTHLYRTDPRDPKIVHLRPRPAPVPTVEFGSGWYHDAEISRSHDDTSHRCL